MQNTNFFPIENMGQLKTLPGIGEAEWNKTQISINKKTGSIQIVSHQNFSALGEAVTDNENTLKKLQVAAKLLKGEDLKEDEKQYKKEAKKIVKFYTKSMGKEIALEEQKQLASVFVKISMGMQSQTAHIQKAQAQTQEEALNQGIRDWTLSNPIMSEGAIKSRFEDIQKDDGHTSDAQDLYRHLMGGQVSVLDDGVNVFDDVHNIAMDNLDGKLDDAEEVKNLHARLGALLDTFKDKATKGMNQEKKANLTQDITEFLDNIALQSSGENATVVIDKTLISWRKGDPAQQNMARLLHSINQSYHMDVMSQGTMGLLRDYHTEDCPHQLLKLGGLGMTMDKDAKVNGKDARNIHVQFDNDQVTVTHEIKLKQTGAQGNLAATQETTLTTDLNDLSDWHFNANVQINAKGSDLSNARKINQIYNEAGIKSRIAVV